MWIVIAQSNPWLTGNTAVDITIVICVTLVVALGITKM
jgi:hypothetical protein